MTSTFATLEVSRACYEEIKAKLIGADYRHAIGQLYGGQEMLDMDEIALIKEPTFIEKLKEIVRRT